MQSLYFLFFNYVGNRAQGHVQGKQASHKYLPPGHTSSPENDRFGNYPIAGYSGTCLYHSSSSGG